MFSGPVSSRLATCTERFEPRGRRERRVRRERRQRRQVRIVYDLPHAFHAGSSAPISTFSPSSALVRPPFASARTARTPCVRPARPRPRSPTRASLRLPVAPRQRTRASHASPSTRSAPREIRRASSKPAARGSIRRGVRAPPSARAYRPEWGCFSAAARGSCLGDADAGGPTPMACRRDASRVVVCVDATTLSLFRWSFIRYRRRARRGGHARRSRPALRSPQSMSDSKTPSRAGPSGPPTPLRILFPADADAPRPLRSSSPSARSAESRENTDEHVVLRRALAGGASPRATFGTPPRRAAASRSDSIRSLHARLCVSRLR